jgi:hypothetical protein
MQLDLLAKRRATVVRSLSAKSVVTVIKSEGGWSLVASKASRSAMSQPGTLRRFSEVIVAVLTDVKIQIAMVRRRRITTWRVSVSARLENLNALHPSHTVAKG